MENDIKTQPTNISFEEFSKIDLRLGKIKKIEYIPKLNKVYKAEIESRFREKSSSSRSRYVLQT